MIIVVAGMKRSGSTWQYNVIRLFIEYSAGEKPIITGKPDEAIAKEDQDPKKLILCKYHPWHRKLNKRASMVFSSNRNWPDAMDSLERFKERPSNKRQKAMLDWHRSWQKVADFYMEFSAFKADPEAMIQLIGLELLRNEVIPTWNTEINKKVIEAMDNLEPPSRDEWYDPETLLFWNHITKESNKA